MRYKINEKTVEIDKTLSTFTVSVTGNIMAFVLMVIGMVLGSLISGDNFFIEATAEIKKAVEAVACTIAGFIVNNTNVVWDEYSAYKAVVASIIILTVIGLGIIGIITYAHELTHKYTWAAGLPKEDKKKITIGIKHMIPYCHCDADLKLPIMILGTITPMIATGLIIIIIGAVNHSMLTVFFGSLGLGGGGGDIISACTMLPCLKYKTAIAGDSADKIGSIIYVDKDEFLAKTKDVSCVAKEE